MMDPDRNVKLRFMSSSVQVTSSNSSRDSHPGSGYVVVDTGSGDMRRLTAYFGGMKMVRTCLCVYVCVSFALIMDRIYFLEYQKNRGRWALK